MSETDKRNDELGPGPVAKMRVIADPAPDLPVGGLLGDVPLVGMMEITSDGSAAGTQVMVNGTPIRMLQDISLRVNADANMVLVELKGLTKDLKLRGAIIQLQEYIVADDGTTTDITEEQSNEQSDRAVGQL
jgi:hypothetical protein